MRRFDGRTVVVTGASSGIGYETARLFAEEGARVFTGDLELAAPPGCWASRVDVCEPDDVAGLIATAVTETGRLDVVVNNAGIGSTTDALECTPAEWDRVFAVNARGVFLGTHFALPTMLAQHSGVIINTASAAGLVGLRDRAAYCASKGAVIAFTRQVAVQYAAQNVRCNSLCPGTVDSPWVGRLIAEAPDAAARRAELIARQPLGRLAQPVEVARAALYLASEDAAFITGTELVIDGGILAG